MASLKDIKRHIVAVKQTQKLTRAMNMVAAAKLRSTQNRTERFRYYAEEHARLIQEIADRSPPDACSLLLPSESSRKVLILGITSDRGLCGSFNTNLCSHLDRQIVAQRKDGYEPELFLIGRKGRDYYNRRKVKIYSDLVGVTGSFDYVLAQKIAEALIEEYMAGNYREIYVMYTLFKSLSRFEVTFERFLPLGQEEETAPKAKSPAPGHDGSGKVDQDYVIEPKADVLLTRLIPRSLSIMIYRAMLESVTSENAARMQAMDNASKSCKDIIESLTMAYNKARQAAVTSELLDIVNGAEALKD
ncbi:MAG: ATP synthase F1 subunit gamma [Deltaproteobacteria bacterium]|jgi:F-type H+-transporting ATPase subunit gamma|nr:ATP synthase F1 subunit gamma [Deltaproteobacteria bacterium]